MKAISIYEALVLLLVIPLSGCASLSGQHKSSDKQTIQELSTQVDELTRAHQILQDRLAQELDDKAVKLKRMEKGLVITFVADILFDSGKAKLRPEAYSGLDKVSRVLQEDVADLKIGVEGHTDNEPIRASGWRSNWELSVARSLAVLHYLQDEKKVEGARLSSIGYGEYQPLADNSTKEGRQANRRVEIVIIPPVSKVRDGSVSAVGDNPGGFE